MKEDADYDAVAPLRFDRREYFQAFHRQIFLDVNLSFHQMAGRVRICIRVSAAAATCVLDNRRPDRIDYDGIFHGKMRAATSHKCETWVPDFALRGELGVARGNSETDVVPLWFPLDPTLPALWITPGIAQRHPLVSAGNFMEQPWCICALYSGLCCPVCVWGTLTVGGACKAHSPKIK